MCCDIRLLTSKTGRVDVFKPLASDTELQYFEISLLDFGLVLVHYFLTVPLLLFNSIEYSVPLYTEGM